MVASKSHTAILLIVLLTFSILGLTSPLFSPSINERTQALVRARIYGQILLFQWLLFVYVRFGIRRAGRTVPELLDPAPWGFRRWAAHIGIGIAVLATWMLFNGVLSSILRPDPAGLAQILMLLPRSIPEKIGWIAVSATAAFCEEFLYRAYLLKQFRGLGGNLAAAIVLQATLYGAAHTSLPIELVISTMLLGLLLGVVAAWRKTVIPGMIAHCGIALLGAFLL